MVRSLGIGIGIGLGGRGRGGGSKAQLISASNRTATPYQVTVVPAGQIYQGAVTAHWTGNTAVANPMFYFPGWQLGSVGLGAEIALGASYKVRCAIRYAGQGNDPTDMTFSGTAEGTVADAGGLWSDPLAGFTIPANTQFWAHCYFEFGSGNNRPVAYTTLAARGEYWIASATQATALAVLSTTAAGVDGFSVPGPMAIVGTNTGAKTQCIMIVNDSIGQGQNEPLSDGNARGDRGYLNRGIDSFGYSFIRIGNNGANVPNMWGATAVQRMAIATLLQPTHILFQVSENSGALGTAGLKTALASLWSAYRAICPTAKFLQAKMGPKTTTTDDYATVANQTVDPSSFYTTSTSDATAIRWSIRNWLDTQVIGQGGVLTGLVDPMPYWYWDGVTNQSYWKTLMCSQTVGFTPIHPTVQGHTDAAAAITVANSAGYFGL